MRNKLTAAGIALAAALLCSGRFAGPQFVPRDENPEDFPAGAGRDDTFYACTACHGFKLIAQQGMSRRQWEELIELMVRRHNMPPLPEKDRRSCSTISRRRSRRALRRRAGAGRIRSRRVDAALRHRRRRWNPAEKVIDRGGCRSVELARFFA